MRRDIKVINFQRREILIAEYREDGIVWDNSGLKGKTADWAKEHMIDNHTSDDEGIITQIRLDKMDQGEEEVYAEYLPKCTHLVYAVGYEKSPLPRITINGEEMGERELEFDMHTSGFFRATTAQCQSQDREEKEMKKQKVKEKVHGLYGTGIAFPEETEDPEGHVEAAVGLAKFFKFAERVKGDWGKVC